MVGIVYAPLYSVVADTSFLSVYKKTWNRRPMPWRAGIVYAHIKQLCGIFWASNTHIQSLNVIHEPRRGETCLCHDAMWTIWGEPAPAQPRGRIRLRLFTRRRAVCYAFHKDGFVSSDANSLMWYLGIFRRRKEGFIMIWSTFSVLWTICLVRFRRYVDPGSLPRRYTDTYHRQVVPIHWKWASVNDARGRRKIRWKGASVNDIRERQAEGNLVNDATVLIRGD